MQSALDVYRIGVTLSVSAQSQEKKMYHRHTDRLFELCPYQHSSFLQRLSYSVDRILRAACISCCSWEGTEHLMAIKIS